MSWLKVFAIVTLGALAGMLLGGLFGFGAGRLAPELFRSGPPATDAEAVGVATVVGATAGVFLGGGLAVFGVLVQVASGWLRRRDADGPDRAAR